MSKSEKALYFAYGSDMSLRQMQQRLIEAEIFLDDSTRSPAKLENYTLAFSKSVPTHSEVGMAGIAPKQGDVVEGILYELPPQAIPVLDVCQGVSEGHYKRECLEVESPFRGKVEAHVYIPCEEWVRPGLKPSRNHLYRLLAAERFLSEPYFNRLKRTESLKVPVDDNGVPHEPAPADKRPRYAPPPPRKGPRFPEA